MPDLAGVSAQNLLNNVTNDVKARVAFDLPAQELGGVFDVMMMGGQNDDLKALAEKMDRTDAADATRDSNRPIEKRATKEAVADTKIALKHKIKNRVKEIVARDQTPVKNDRPLKALKKVAEFLLKADTEGKIDLPPELVQKLQEFLGKADTLKAAETADFMRDFIDLFRGMKINLGTAIKAATILTDAEGKPLETAQPDTLHWPEEIVQAFKELHLGGYAIGKKLDVMQAIKAIKALVNSSESAAIQSLNEKSQEDLQAKDPASVVVPVAAVIDAADATVIEALTQPAQNKVLDVAANIPAKAAIGKNSAQVAETSAAIAIAEKSALPALEDFAAGTTPQTKNDIQKNAVLVKKGDEIISAKDALKPNVLPQPVVNGAAARVEAAQIVAATSGEAKAASPVNAASLTQAQMTVAGLDQPGSVQQPNNRFAAAVTSAAQTLAYGKNAAVEQVVVQLQNRANKASQITVQLTPAELGRVDVRLDVKRDGQTHAVIIADKPETLALLQKDATQLEKALQHAGLNANAENMSFNLREQRQANQGFSRNKRLGRDATDTAPIKELALNVHGDGTVISDNRVNYHA